MIINENSSISKTYKKLLFLSLAIVGLLCVAQVVVSRIILLGVFALFMVLMVYATLRGLAVPLLLFFMPWAPLLKLAPGQISMYTIAFFVVCVTAFANHFQKIRFNYFIFPVLLLFVTGVSKFIARYYVDRGYFLFFVFLIIFPALFLEFDGEYDFYIITVFFATGVISASLLAKQLTVYPSISRFIDVFNWEQMGIVRYSGFYGDSNFYSTHITACLGGILFLLLKTDKLKRILVLVALAIASLYCGFLGASKSFVLLMMLIFAIWILLMTFMKNKISTKLLLFASIFVLFIFIFSTEMFSSVIDVILTRFGQGTDASTLTTGRTELWTSYISVLTNDAKTLLIGRGYTNINVGGRASHNTPIQLIYQFGIIGAALLIMWIVTIGRNALSKVDFSKVNVVILLMLTIACFGLWLGLDLLFFDEFFLIFYYYFFAIKSAEKTKPKEIKREPES